MKNKSYWLDTAELIENFDCSKPTPEVVPLVIIGSGFSGACLAHLLSQNDYFDYIKVLDYDPSQAATFRNCGHILTGPAESASALTAMHGEEVAKKIWDFTVTSCQSLKDFVEKEGVAEKVGYKQEGQFCLAIDDTEAKENMDSAELLKKWGYDATIYSYPPFLEQKFGLKNIINAKWDPLCATAHPLKYRNALLESAKRSDKVSLTSGIRALDVEQQGDEVLLQTSAGPIRAAVVIVASNAYAPLMSKPYAERRLVEPFKGQLMVSKPLKHPEKLTDCPHNFDHGFEYALKTPDGRLMLGGWRNKVDGKEIGRYDFDINSEISEGLKTFAQEHYALDEELEWDYQWTGVMAASRNGLPVVGPLSDLIYTVSPCTGHGFSQHFAACKLLVDIMLGNEYDKELAGLFNPKGQ